MRKKCFLFLCMFWGMTLVLCGQSLWNVDHLAQVKQSIDQPYYSKAYAELKKQADALLHVEALSVMMKEQAPISGDKHDYMSLARDRKSVV